MLAVKSIVNFRQLWIVCIECNAFIRCAADVLCMVWCGVVGWECGRVWCGIV